ncbi:hypothetical protein LOK49_LG10G01997 [Camellia lanceoleosa]|uniref:Uncharacterized protein n=1 Tax=Camellia lanceoleosa TaxID=1840588 RepID=A0ACC0G8Y5_9ERIC|nr:hypothetical protein LOK49_LG10G01997 [Camellia lanceoleosa]
MAEENHETKLPQQQFAPESTFFPPRTTLKTTWPELVGLPAEEAERKIKEEMPEALIQVVPPDCLVTMEFIESRVRLYVDSSGKIVNPPIIG